MHSDTGQCTFVHCLAPPHLHTPVVSIVPVIMKDHQMETKKADFDRQDSLEYHGWFYKYSEKKTQHNAYK